MGLSYGHCHLLLASGTEPDYHQRQMKDCVGNYNAMKGNTVTIEHLSVSIREANLATCVYCKNFIDAEASTTYRRGTGWFKRQKGGRGTNSAAMVKWSTIYACKPCIQKQLHGVSVDQMELFHVPYPSEDEGA